MTIPKDYLKITRQTLKDHILTKSYEPDELMAEFVIMCIEQPELGPALMAYGREYHHVWCPPEFTPTERSIWFILATTTGYVKYWDIIQSQHSYDEWSRVAMKDKSQLDRAIIGLRAHIKNMRRRLKDAHYSYAIENKVRHGYKLVEL